MSGNKNNQSTGKGKKDGNAKRPLKVSDEIVNSTSDTTKAAAESQKAELAKRAEAVGLPTDALLQDIEIAELKKGEEAYKATMAKKDALKEKNPKIWALMNFLEDMFGAREKSNLPKHTETEVLAAAGKIGSSAALAVNYTNEEKTKGFITMSEGGVDYRFPEEGEVNFGFDYAKAAKDLAAANAQTEEAK